MKNKENNYTTTNTDYAQFNGITLADGVAKYQYSTKANYKDIKEPDNQTYSVPDYTVKDYHKEWNSFEPESHLDALIPLHREYSRKEEIEVLNGLKEMNDSTSISKEEYQLFCKWIKDRQKEYKELQDKLDKKYIIPSIPPITEEDIDWHTYKTQMLMFDENITFEEWLKNKNNEPK